MVKAHLAVPGPDIFAEQRGEDLYIALEQVALKLARQLRKRKTELKDKPRAKAQKKAELEKSGQMPQRRKRAKSRAAR
jgi:putative sigma-54 modulation protein